MPRREDVIPQRPFGVLGVLAACGSRAEQRRGELEHVVGVAGLGRVDAEAVVQPARRRRSARRRCCRR